MTELNSAFPVYDREAVLSNPREISLALLKSGVCYITGYHHEFERILADYNSLGLNSDASVKTLSPATAKKKQTSLYSTLFAPEFKAVKRYVLGRFYKDEIEIFCQHTGFNKAPPSGVLHFDKRYTFKSWYYLNDVGADEGPMRVVPLDRCEEHSPRALRAQFGSRNLFKGSCSQHKATGKAFEALELAAERVTGPKGTLFLHITEAWHGASPVLQGCERKIIRAHSRPFSDYFLR